VHEQIAANKRKTILLIAGFVLLLSLVEQMPVPLAVTVSAAVHVLASVGKYEPL